MNTLTKKIVLSGLVMLLSACAYHPNHYNSYPGNGSYYPGSGYGNYQRQQNYPRPSGSFGYSGYGRHHGGHHSDNNYYQNNNYYNQPHPSPRQRPGSGNQGGGWSGHHRDHENDHTSWGGWQGRNNQPQPMQGHHDDRQHPIARGDNNPRQEFGHNGRGHNNERHQQHSFGR